MHLHSKLLILYMHSAANIMYALTPIVTILIHTSCVCTVTAHVAGFMSYKNLFLEFSSTTLNDSTITSTPLSYKDWLPLWKEHLTNTPEVPVIPQSACKISTPLNTQNWHQYLLGHPDQELVSYFLEGISAGFRIGLSTPAHSLHSAHRNLRAALLHPQIVDDYLQTELSLGRISGPFLKSQCSTVQISRFGVIPKRHQPNKW